MSYGSIPGIMVIQYSEAGRQYNDAMLIKMTGITQQVRDMLTGR